MIYFPVIRGSSSIKIISDLSKQNTLITEEYLVTISLALALRVLNDYGVTGGTLDAGITASD